MDNSDEAVADYPNGDPAVLEEIRIGNRQGQRIVEDQLCSLEAEPVLPNVGIVLDWIPGP